MSDTELRDLLDRLAATAPEPTGDPAAEVYRRLGHQVRRRRRARRGLVPIAVALATVLALLAAVGLVGLLDRSEPAEPAAPAPAAQAATTAAREFATTFFTFDYRDVDRFIAEVSADSTGGFRQDFISRQGQLAATLQQVQSVATARVPSVAAREVTPTSARVLAVADQEVRNKASQGRPVTNRYRLAIGMRLIDGRWLAEAIEPVLGGAAAPSRCGDATAGPERDEILRQTCSATATLFSFDYRTLDTDLVAQRALTTGPFRNEVENLTGPSLRPVAGRVGARVTATASDAAVVRQDATSATVLVFINQDVRTNLLKEPRMDRNRVEVTMTRVGDRWLVSGVRAL